MANRLNIDKKITRQRDIDCKRNKKIMAPLKYLNNF